MSTVEEEGVEFLEMLRVGNGLCKVEALLGSQEVRKSGGDRRPLYRDLASKAIVIRQAPSFQISLLTKSSAPPTGQALKDRVSTMPP
jgi:hypothetical protein